MDTSRHEIGSSASNYQILARLAKGGMAELFLARATSAAGVSRFVVMKRVLRERADDFQFLQMFLDEARLAAQLQHPNIAQVYDVGRLGESYFFTMEYVHGETVRAIMARAAQAQRALPIACALAIAAGAAAGLHHAHDRIGIDGKALGIVHRDVSPSNLMVGYEGHVKVVDFGVAKAATSENVTHSGTVKGKIAYLSPEQAIGRDIDRRSDVFSLGIVLWEMLTGRRLFKRESDFLSMRAIVDDDVPAPSTVRADVSPALDAVVLKALAKTPADRYQTAQELFDAIERYAQDSGQAISSAVLSRVLRELFGSRPEPWLVLQREAQRTGVTLTAQPIPPSLVRPPPSPVDAQLASVVDLRSVETYEERTRPYVIVDASGTVRPIEMPRKFRSLWLVAGALVLAAIAAVAIAATAEMKVDTSNAAASTDAAPTSAANIDAPPIGAPKIDAAMIDAASIEQVTIDAGASPVDAAPLEPDAAAPDAAVPDSPEKPKRAPTDRERLGACVTKLSSPAECVMVACRLRRADRARAWFAQVPAGRRGQVTTRCRAAGIDLAPKPQTNCDADPSRCQF